MMRDNRVICIAVIGWSVEIDRAYGLSMVWNSNKQNLTHDYFDIY